MSRLSRRSLCFEFRPVVFAAFEPRPSFDVKCLLFLCHLSMVSPCIAPRPLSHPSPPVVSVLDTLSLSDPTRLILSSSPALSLSIALGILLYPVFSIRSPTCFFVPAFLHPLLSVLVQLGCLSATVFGASSLFILPHRQMSTSVSVSASVIYCFLLYRYCCYLGLWIWDLSRCLELAGARP